MVALEASAMSMFSELSVRDVPDRMLRINHSELEYSCAILLSLVKGFVLIYSKNATDKTQPRTFCL